MPWKLLALIVMMALILVFVGFNIENRSDVSLVFYTLTDVPVVITLLSAFVLGLVVAFLVSLGRVFKASPAGAKPRKRFGKAALDVDEGDAYIPGPPPAETQGGPVKAKKGRSKAQGDAGSAD